MPRVADTSKTVIDKMICGTDLKLVNWFHPNNVNLTHEELNASIDEPENRWNLHLMSYDTFTSIAKSSSHSQLSYCVWHFGIFDESYRYKTKGSVGLQIAMNAKIEFKLQITATPGFHSLYDLCFQTMWLFAAASDYPENDSVMENHLAEALYSTEKSLMNANQMEEEEAQQDAALQMIQIAMP